MPPQACNQCCHYVAFDPRRPTWGYCVAGEPSGGRRGRGGEYPRVRGVNGLACRRFELRQQERKGVR